MELAGLFESSHMQYDIDRNDPHYEKAGEPHIKDMTEKAIQILSKNPKGYFLLVEGGFFFFLKDSIIRLILYSQIASKYCSFAVGGKIDLAHHGSRPVRSLHDVVAMDLAVDKAASITNNQDTLIVVTADHSHTFVISGYPHRGNGIFGNATLFVFNFISTCSCNILPNIPLFLWKKFCLNFPFFS